MPVIPMILKAIMSIAMSLVTEKFIKAIILIALDKLVKSSENSLDDQLLAEIKKALESPVALKG